MGSEVDLRDKEEVPTGGKVPQILTAVILNILSLGIGASYGIPNVFYIELDIKECNGLTLSTPIPNTSPVTMPNPNASNPTENPIEKKECAFTIDTTQKSLIFYSLTVN